MSVRTRALAAGSVLAVIAVSPLSAKPSFVTFEAPGAGTTTGSGTYAYSVNRDGSMTGSAFGNDFKTHSFVRHADGTFLSFPEKAGAAYSAESINAHGMTTGFYTEGSDTLGFVAKEASKAKRFSASDDALNTIGNAIGDSGDVAGYYAGPGNVVHGFVRDKKGNPALFDAPGALLTSSGGTFPFAIDADGTAAGYFIDGSLVSHGFLRAADGSFTVITDPNGGMGTRQGTKVLGINTLGEASGYYLDSQSVRHGFKWSDGQFSEFDVKGAGKGEGQGTYSRAINEKGTVTGWWVDANGVNHGFVRSSKGKVTAFDAPGAGTGSGQGTIALSISDKDIIGGYYLDNAGVAHGFVRLAK